MRAVPLTAMNCRRFNNALPPVSARDDATNSQRPLHPRRERYCVAPKRPWLTTGLGHQRLSQRVAQATASRLVYPRFQTRLQLGQGSSVKCGHGGPCALASASCHRQHRRDLGGAFSIEGHGCVPSRIDRPDPCGTPRIARVQVRA